MSVSRSLNAIYLLFFNPTGLSSLGCVLSQKIFQKKQFERGMSRDRKYAYPEVRVTGSKRNRILYK